MSGPHGSAFSGRVGWGARPAVVVIDLVRAYTDPAGPFGLPDAGPAVAATQRLVDAARAGGHPVAWTVVRYAPDLADGGLAQALVEAALRFGIGARIFLDELCERDGIDLATALFSESTGRVIVSVPREDDVRFVGLCEARRYPVQRIGVTDGLPDAAPSLNLQGMFDIPLADLRAGWSGTLPKHFA